MTIVALVALPAAVVYGALLEWFVHGVVFHRWAAALHAPHHAEFHGAQFQRPGPYRNLQRWWLEPAALALHAPVFALLAWGLGAGVAIAALAALAAYAYATNFVHTSIHCPDGRWIERTAWHRRLVERHREHHRHAGVNLGVTTQIADRVMRSFRPAAAAPARRATPARSCARRS